jgi:hypothetical protein
VVVQAVAPLELGRLEMEGFLVSVSFSKAFEKSANTLDD